MLTISLVTPTLNQGRYLAEALDSVLDQGDPALEYVVADGGSTDGSVALIESRADRLTDWWSRPDGGHADAVNQGFARTSGEIMGWLNSDDRLLPGSLAVVRELFERFPDLQWLTSGFPLTLDRTGHVVRAGRVLGFAKELYLLGLNGLRDWSPLYFVQQESTFWRRGLWDAAGGGLDPTYEPAADFELWARFFQHAELWTVDTPLGCFRVHPAQRTASQLDEYRREALRALGPAASRSLVATRAVARVPAPLRRRAGLGSSAPFVSWSRRTGEWHAGRRPVP